MANTKAMELDLDNEIEKTKQEGMHSSNVSQIAKHYDHNFCIKVLPLFSSNTSLNIPRNYQEFC